VKQPTTAPAAERLTVAMDLAKSVFQVAISRVPGRIESHHRLPRRKVMEFFARLEPAIVYMEACGSAHFWARQLRTLGHEPRLLPAQHVAKCRIGNKTDRIDTEAILAASRREVIRPVPVKSIEQQVIATLHRLRQGWITTRTARLNALRGVLREFGVVIRPGAARVQPAVSDALQSGSVPGSLSALLASLCDEVRELSTRIAEVEAQLAATTAEDPVVERLRTIPGFGLLSSSAFVSTVVDPRRFPSARHTGSFVGLVPKECSSGERRRLGAITKCGDVYLRTLLISGARSVLHHAKRQKKPDRLRAWALRLEASRGHNRAAIALANRLARIAWAVWIKDRVYESKPA